MAEEAGTVRGRQDDALRGLSPRRYLGRFAEALERLELEALPASGNLRESSTGGSQMDLCLAQLGRIEEAREGLPEEPGSGRMERRHRTPV